MAKKIRKRNVHYYSDGGIFTAKNFNGGKLNGTINAIGNLAGGVASGGLSTGVGKTMQGLSSVASLIPGPWGAVAGAGLNLVGGLVNRAFGSQINQQAVDGIKTANTSQSNIQFNASSNDDLLSQGNFGFLGNIDRNNIGKDGWFSNRAKNLTAQLNAQRQEANIQALSNYATAVSGLDNRNDLMINANFAALGGPINMLYSGSMSPFGNRFNTGGNLNRVTTINEGGTHEENPYEGVQVGIDAQGIPNLVEEGEVIFNDYVFSDRLKVPNSIKSSLGLSKGKTLTFAKAAKKLSKEAEERPNDPISKRGLLNSMFKLQQAQELLRQQDQGENNGVQYAHGGKMGTLFAGNIGDDIPQYLRKPDSLYDWSGIDTMFDNWSFNHSNLKENLPYTRGSNTNIANNSSPERHNAFTDYALSLPNTHSYWSTLSSKTGKPISYLRENYNSLRNDGKLGYVSLDPKIQSSIPNFYPIPKDIGPTWPAVFNTGYNVEIPYAPVKDSADTNNTTEVNTEESETYKGNIDNSSGLTWLRYAPVVGAAIGLGQNIFNKPDYSSSDVILNAANETGKYTPIRFNPLGDYLTYSPFDRDYYINKLNAQSSATRRAIVDQSAGNRATAIAGLLANDYNTQSKLGDLARQAEEYNLAQRERVSTFNRNTNQFNSEMELKSAMANQEAALRTKNQRFSGIAQAMQIRDAIDARRGTSMSANLTNFFNSLGDIGREEYTRNMIMSNPALYYSIDSNGNISYKNGYENLSEAEKKEARNAARAKKKKAKGDYLTIKEN